MSDNIPPNTIPQFSFLKLEAFQGGQKFKGVMIENNDVHIWKRLTQIANFLKIWGYYLFKQVKKTKL